ncbi:heptosyltransferase-1 [Paraburkholderia caballeronis]|uniref:lipopolysaccharide heptosyltransferase I n=1 Tax=Paraburkholderia caballeronis TaxID=416943 RepID=UPI0010656416|nr:lipopolysaccharide heptosyltransferase I [Paraburkholderia caballeronis]TDV25016.1 heptosyltransferase-1 [Paraburkholderia caballeronis]
MKRILVIKVTSLGDVVEALPVVADIRRAFPGVSVDWAVDESFADVVRWNAGVDRVLCAPLRRFKRARGGGDLLEIVRAIRDLRAERYDAVIDIHGVYKSAIIARLARARRRFGYRADDLGERGAAFAYNGRFGPRPDCDAWHGMRVSAGEALGYAVDTPPDFGLRVPRDGEPALPPPDGPVALLFHATSKDEKKWPVEHWGALGRELTARGLRIELPWGSDAERATAADIAALVPGAAVLPRLSVRQLARRIEDASLVVGADTGFVHLAHALMKPTVMVFVATSPFHCGVAAPGRSISVGDGVCVPSVAQVLDAVERVRDGRCDETSTRPGNVVPLFITAA